MSAYPDYAVQTRNYWQSMHEKWVSPGRRHWSTSNITWGIWGVPESDVRALGDLGWFDGKEALELGCGTGYVSAWLARIGAKPVGIDITPGQLDSARGFQKEFGIEFPLIEGSAEAVPLPDESFDFAISEYGAAIWCDPYKWIPEAARLLRPGGRLVFLGNSFLSILCSPDSGPATPVMCRDQFGSSHMYQWDGVSEFHLPHGQWIRLLNDSGFRVDGLIELEPPAGAQEGTWFDYMTLDWAKRWPSEEIWQATRVR